MTSEIINRIGTKVRVTLASIVVAGVVLAAAPGFASAQGCADLDGTGHVDVSDILMVMSRYLQPKPSGGVFTVQDILEVTRQYGTSCKAS